jgi:hypothetical protein
MQQHFQALGLGATLLRRSTARWDPHRPTSVLASRFAGFGKGTLRKNVFRATNGFTLKVTD